MSAQPVAELQSLSFRRAANGLPVVTAEGGVGALAVALGFGAADEEVIPEALFQALLDGVDTPGATGLAADVASIRDDIGEQGVVWLRVNDGVPAAGVAWVAVCRADGVDLVGVQSLSAPPVRLPGLAASGSAWLGATLRLRGGGETLTVQHARLLLHMDTTAEAGAGSGPFSLEGASGSLAFTIHTARLPPVSELLDDPAAALQGAWTAELDAALGFAAEGQFFGMSVAAGRAMRIHGNVRSLAGQTDLTLERLHITDQMMVEGNLPQGVGGLALLLRAELTDVRLDQGSSPGLRLEVEGEATLALSLDAGPALSQGFSGSVEAQAQFVHEPAGEDRLSLMVQTGGPVPAPGVNRFGLPPADLHLTLVRPPASDDSASRSWQLVLRSRFVQSWQQVALALDGAVGMLPGVEGAGAAALMLPDLRVALQAELGGNSPRLMLDLELVELAGGTGQANASLVDRYSRYSGPLGPLPLDIADAAVHLALPLEPGGMPTASGQARIRSAWRRIGGADVLPSMSDVHCEFALQSASGSVPELKLTAEGGFPPVRLPVPGHPPITLLRPERFEVTLGAAFSITAEAVLADESLFEALEQAFHVPAQWQSLVNTIQTAVADTRGRLRICLPVTETDEEAPCQAPTLRIELRAAEDRWIDLFETLAGVIGQGSPPPVETPDDAPIDGRPVERSSTLALDHSPGEGPFALRPDVLVFEVSLPASGPELYLHAGVVARVLGETFDAGLYFELAGGLPTLRLAAGVEDPIRISVPGPDPGFVDVPALLQQVRAELFAGDPAQDAQIQEMLEQWNVIFSTLAGEQGEPFMVFEGRNLQLRFAFGTGGLEVGASGGLQVVQLPPLLNDVLPLPGPTAVLGVTATSIYIELQPPFAGGTAETVPFISLPLAPAGTVGPNGDVLEEDQNLDLYFGGFAVGYSWAPSAVQLRLRAGLGLPGLLLNLADFSPIVYRLPPGQQGIPSAWMDVELRQLTAKAPPIVLWSLKFGDTDATHAQNRGLEYVLQIPRVPDPANPLGQPLLRQQDLFVQYLRQFSLIPMTQFMYPAIVLDWGMQVGPDQLVGTNGQPQPVDPVLRMQFRGTTLYLLPAQMAPLFPWTLTVPPALPIPPWSLVGALGLWPGFAVPMLDLYTGPPLPAPGSGLTSPAVGGASGDATGDSPRTRARKDQAIQILARIPHVVRVEAGLSRPVPGLPIPALIELALLGQQVLEGDLDGLHIPPGSAVRDIAYLEAELRVDLPVLAVFGPQLVQASPFPFEAQVRLDLGDALNLLFPVVRGVSRSLVAAQEAAADAAGTALERIGQTTSQAEALFLELDRRQSDLVRLAPVRFRRMHHSLQSDFVLPGFEGVSLGCVVAACLLTPEELAYELRLYHERLRPRKPRLEDAVTGGYGPGGSAPPPAAAPTGVLGTGAQVALEAVLFDSHPSVEQARNALAQMRGGHVVEAAMERSVQATLDAMRSVRSPRLRQAWLWALGLSTRREPELQRWVRGGGELPATILQAAVRKNADRRGALRLQMHHAFVKDADTHAAALVHAAIRFELDDRLEPRLAVVAVPDPVSLVEEHARRFGLGVADTTRMLRVVRSVARERERVLTAREVNALRASVERDIAAAFGRRAAERGIAELARGLARDAVPAREVPQGRIVRNNPADLERMVLRLLDPLRDAGRWTARFSELARKVASQQVTREEFEQVAATLVQEFAALIVSAGLIAQRQGVSHAHAPMAWLGLVSEAAGLPAWQRVTVPFNPGYSTSLVDIGQVGVAWTSVLNGQTYVPVAEPEASDTRRVSQGFVLRCRNDQGGLLDEAIFQHAVASANPVFDVVARAGSYRLRIWGVDRLDDPDDDAPRHVSTHLLHEIILPAQVTALEPDVPGKAERLRARITAIERAVQEPADPPPEPPLEFGPTFHRKSVFWTAADPDFPVGSSTPSPLFEIAAPTAGQVLPGSHGRLNLADLLVRWQGNTPDYLVPNRPVLLAGLDLTLLAQGTGSAAGRLMNDFVVRLRGVVLPGDSRSAQAAGLLGASAVVPQAASLFFSARVAHTLEFGNATLQLDGEVRYMAGPAWDGVSLDVLDDGLGFGPGLRFRGVARLTVGEAVVEGAAEGAFHGDSLSLDLSAALNIPQTTVSAGDIANSLSNSLITNESFPNLASVSYAAHGQAHLHLDVRGDGLAMSASAEGLHGHVQVNWELLEQIPETVGEVCAWTLRLFEEAQNFPQALVNVAISLAEAALSAATGNEVKIILNTRFLKIEIGVFERVCEQIVENTEHVLPRSTRIPPLNASPADVSVSGSFDSDTGEAHFEFALRTKAGDEWRWGVNLNGNLPPWFALPPSGG